MSLSRFAMIIKGRGYDPHIHREEMASPFFATTIVCVSSFEQAVPVVQELAEQGIQLIELCGGFSPDEADQLQSSLIQPVPIGVVRYSSEEQHKLSELFNSFPRCTVVV